MPKPVRHEKPVSRPAPIGPANPAWWDRYQSVMVEHDHAVRAIELRWGIGRLAMLVSETTRMRFRKGMDQWQAALRALDLDEIERLAPLIRQALAYMEREARAAGHTELSPVVWETQRDDGTVLAVVRTLEEAAAVAAEGREVEIWALSEIARVLPRSIGAIKQTIPGARVQKLTVLHEGAATDWATADRFLEEHADVPAAAT